MTDHAGVSSIVVDSSVAIKWPVPEDHTSEALSLLEAVQDAAIALRAPDLVFAEVGSIVWKKRRFQGMSVEDAQEVLKAFLGLDLAITPTRELLADAWRLADVHGRTVYDCLYLALSLREDRPLITADERLYNALHASYPRPTWLPAWQSDWDDPTG